MEQISVNYVRTSDGFDIAYRVAGQGPPFVLAPAVMGQISDLWERFPGLFQALSQRFTVVQYDSRGQGLSSRGLPSVLTRADLLRDLVTVVDHLQLERFVLYAAGGFGHVALDYALARPERLIGLVLHFVSIANAAWGRALWNDLPEENWDYFLESLIPAGLPSDEHARRLRNLHATATFEDYKSLTDLLMTSNVAPLLGEVRTPVLVLHARDTNRLPASESMKLAAAIPGASFVLHSGESGWQFPLEGVGAIEQFIDGLAQTPKAVTVAPSRLSRRETEVLRLIASGRSNQQIADELVLSLRTVERHITNLYAKIGAHGKADATAYALRHGIE